MLPVTADRIQTASDAIPGDAVIGATPERVAVSDSPSDHLEPATMSAPAHAVEHCGGDPAGVDSGTLTPDADPDAPTYLSRREARVICAALEVLHNIDRRAGDAAYSSRSSMDEVRVAATMRALADRCEDGLQDFLRSAFVYASCVNAREAIDSDRARRSA